jgi:hypothetical protein
VRLVNPVCVVALELKHFHFRVSEVAHGLVDDKVSQGPAGLLLAFLSQ